MAGAHAPRVINVTGTPFNNNHQDMATLMSFCDWRRAGDAGKFNSATWWHKATGCCGEISHEDYK